MKKQFRKRIMAIGMSCLLLMMGTKTYAGEWDMIPSDEPAVQESVQDAEVLQDNSTEVETLQESMSDAEVSKETMPDGETLQEDSTDVEELQESMADAEVSQETMREDVLQESDFDESIVSIKEDETLYILSEGGFFEESPEIYTAVENKNAIKAKIESALRTWQEYADLSEFSNELDSTTAFALFREVLNDNPDLFYVKGKVGASWGYNMFRLSLTYGDYSLEEVEHFYSVGNSIVEQIPDTYSDIEKLLFLHDYLVTHCTYDMSLTKYNAYNALIDGTCVCQGYSEAYRYLASLVGIDVQIVTSWNLNHAWNIVALNGNYYFIDCTWDDPVGLSDPAYCGHSNFLRSTQGMIATDHSYDDWVLDDGTNVYNYATDSSLYDNSYWKGHNRAVSIGAEINVDYWGTPIITGEPKVGQTLTAQVSGGTIAGPYSYQWRRNKTPIDGATAATYRLTKNDIGTEISCEIHASGNESVLIAELAKNITFDPVPATELKFGKTSLTLKVGESGEINATLLPKDTTDSIYWESTNPAIVEVDQNGKIVAKKTGTTTVRAKTVKHEMDPKAHDSLQASCKITVIQPVTTVTFDKSSVTINVGTNATIKATVKPDDASDKTLKWTTSKNTVATVNSKGVVTAVGPGTATITATAADGSGVKSTCTVKVIQPVTGITLNEKEITLQVNDKTTLTATVLPDNATNKQVKWTSTDAKIAKVSSKGVVTAVGTGTVTITATAADGSGKKAECKVKVIKPVTGISLNKTSAKLTTGKTLTLKATLEPTDATDKTVEWTTSDKNVATVNSKGVVTAVGPGEARITAYAKGGFGVSIGCVVKVTQLVTQIKLNKTNVSLNVNDKTTLTATALPDNANNKKVKWTTSDPAIATVDEKGNVTAVGYGTTTITATAADGSGVSSTCQVKVAVLVTKVTLDRTSATVHENDTLSLNATVSPKQAENKKVNWKSSDTKIATVDANGKVTAVGAGTVKITATAADGSGKSASCTINVLALITNVFSDISANDWWAQAVQYVYDNKIMSGTGTNFEPKKLLTREEFVQVLYNHSGKPSTKGIANKFSDVKDSWYKDAVLWANKNDIANGYENGKFGVGEKITREQMTVMLYKYAKLKGFDLTATKGLTDQFKDGKKVDSWAKEAMNWAVSQGIMSGKGDGTDKSKLLLDPLGNATRAECASMIMKLLIKNGIN